MEDTTSSIGNGSALSEIETLTHGNENNEASNPFSKLPTEIIQHIAYLLMGDTDVSNFSSVCTILAERVLPPHSSIWRRRFKDRYDLPQGRSSAEIKIEYQIRSIVLSQNISFKDGEKDEQKLWLEVVKSLLLESFLSSSTNHGDLTSKNLDRIHEVLSESSFLNRPVSGYSSSSKSSPSDSFCAVQLCLTYLCLDLSISYRCLRTDYNLASVYSYDNTSDEPFISLERLNLEKILHIRNFWQRHLTNPDEATFHSSFENIPEAQRPKAWERGLGDNAKIGTSWLGYYSCIHPRAPNLSSLEDRQTCADLDSHWTHTLPLSLHLIHDSDPLNWPALFDTIVPILGPEDTRHYFCGVQKFYHITDTSNYLVRGFTESISLPQGGIPGWKRICFTIYNPNRDILKLILPDEDENDQGKDSRWLPDEEWPPVDLETDFHWIFGYEGVLLPGGRIMIGRWINMGGISDEGPFIFWNT